MTFHDAAERQIYLFGEAARLEARLAQAGRVIAERDQLAANLMLQIAAAVDLRGLEVWWANGPYCDGCVTSVEDDPDDGPVLVLDEIETGDDGEDDWKRVPLLDVVCAGWLEDPDDPADPDSDGFTAMLRALARRAAP